MMIALPGFQIVSLLKAGVKAVIYRGIKVKDRCPVIIKGLRPEQCTPNNIEQLKHEYAIAQRLNIAAALIVYALEMHQGIPYLIMEDFQARSLDQFLDQFQQPVPFLKIAIEITSKLAQIHTHHIVHKDIKPQNILINLETSQVKIADFGIAAFIPYQQQIVSSSSRIEGSLPYLSPEQTGQMNRGIDHRSDLYSLGITFYEMLTGQLPFQGKDPLEWVHCHIAKSPPSPKKLNSDIPQMLCDIIIKLLSKVAEQRYQSALGLQFDLERCLKQLEITGQIQSFVLGEQDISERFQIPQKLYGREPEIAKLLQAFERVVSQGKPELVLVSGYAGVGKSSLVKDVAHRSAIAIDNARLYQEAQQAQKTAERALERIARLQSITAALSESLTPAQVSDVIVEQSMTALGASSALVALVNESKTELEIVRAVGYKQDLIDAWRIFAIDSPSPLAEAVRTGKPIWAESTENRVADYPHLAEIYAQYDFNAWISIPLMVDGWAVGGISLGFTQPQQLSGEDQAFILAVAQQCAQAIAVGFQQHISKPVDPEELVKAIASLTI